MQRKPPKPAAAPAGDVLAGRYLVLGVGSFTHAVMQILKESGADVAAYLTRDYAHYPPSLAGPAIPAAIAPNLGALLQRHRPALIIPMSIDWHQAPWAKTIIELGVPVLSPAGEAIKIERDREFAHQLCQRFGVPFPRSFFAATRAEASAIVRREQLPFVIKNPLCSPTSPIHTILCESAADTLGWIERLDDSEGIFLQEYMGRAEAGHIAFISNGDIHSVVTNQEYKRAFTGNMGIVAGAPLGGLVEKDPHDKYGLAQALLQPLLPWFREVHYHGPIQVTAIFRDNRWYVLEYNVRLGVTCAAMLLRMLRQPAQTLLAVAQNRTPQLDFHEDMDFGCSLTLAGYGYPFIKLSGPLLPVYVDGDFDCDVWWNEVTAGDDGQRYMTGHRIADVVALDETLPGAIERAYRNIRKIRCLSSYYRTDVGQSLWPPGQA